MLADKSMDKRRKQLRAALASPARPRVIIVNYDVLPYSLGKDIEALSRQLQFDALILDE